MGHFLIVSRVDKLLEHSEIAKEYDVGFEINDFYEPDILDDADKLNAIVDRYLEIGIPNDSTMHGAFYDLAIFSRDKKISEISCYRMKQCMDIAKRLGIKSVVFHTNYNSKLSAEIYVRSFIDASVLCLKELLEKYPDINIYLENMFDETPLVLKGISECLKEYDNYGVCFDYSHALVFGKSVDIESWIEELKEYIKHIHINDNDLEEDLHWPLGSGKIDWNIFSMFYEKYFTPYTILIETNEPVGQKKSLEFLKEILDNKNERGLTTMDKKQRLSAEEMLEAIFYDMNLLVVEKDFYNSILLLTDLGRTLVNAERASFWYRDVRKKQYWTLAALDSERITVGEGSGIVGASIENNETILINNPYEDSRFNSEIDKETGFVTKSILCVPVTNGCGEVIGAYQAINKIGEDEKSEFDEQDIKRLALAAAYCGKTLEAQLLREQSQIDQLTGLKNRRGYYDYYDNNMNSKDRSQKSSIIVCDIDFFKKVNDTYGHNVGDAVLVFVADTMQRFVGKAGEVFRWGGEEFIILFKGCDIEEAAKLADELRVLIQDSECRFDNHIVKITMSFGVSEIDKNISSEKNVKSADEKLYIAKQTGRNKVVS